MKFVYDPYGYPRDTFKFCSLCRTKLSTVSVDGRRRKVCRGCGYIYYRNPVPVAGCLVVDDHRRILLVKRGLEPAKGAWSLPCGFIELEESPMAAARRELYEETGVRGDVIGLQGIYYEPSYRYTSLLVAVYLFRPRSLRIRPGDDAEDAAFFPLNRMPRLGLSTHRLILRDYLRQTDQRLRRPKCRRLRRRPKK